MVSDKVSQSFNDSSGWLIWVVPREKPSRPRVDGSFVYRR